MHLRADRAGLSLVEATVSLALVGIGLMVTLPALASLRSRAATAAGARALAMTLHGLSWKSVAQGRSHGLLFERDEQGWSWYEVRDENRNGLRTAELRDGVDRRLSGPHRLEDRVPDVTLGFPFEGTFPKIPPGHGLIERLDDPVRIGKSDLLAFGPLGTASSGTLYVTDLRESLYAVVLYGRTARVRVWRYDREQRRWTR